MNETALSLAVSETFLPNLYNTMRRVGMALCLAMTLSGGLAISQSAPRSTVKCTRATAFTLNDMIKTLDAPSLSEARKLALIASCPVAFPMDAAAIDRLSADPHATPAIMDALNKATAAQLSVDQARAQVSGLELHLGEIDASVAKDRDAALAKLDADYPAQREKAGHVEPKGQFETTAAYNQRIQDSQSALSAMDARHQADRSRIAADFTAKSTARQAPVRKRIAFLKQASYPDLRPASYGSYNPDSGILTATLAGDEYRFEKVLPAQAETLSKSWPKVKLTQPYSEDDLHTRSLVLDSASISVAGYSRKAKTDQLLASAKAMIDRRDFTGALRGYQAVLAVDANNQVAKDGVEAAQAGHTAWTQKMEKLPEEQRLAGEWVDPSTNLMWTLKGSEHSLNWTKAQDYCSALRTGGYRDWRMATLPELKSVFDPKTKSPKPYRDFTGRTLDIYIKGGILPVKFFIWSSTQDPSDSLRAWTFMFGINGGTDKFTIDDGMGMGVLCVRRYTAPAETDDPQAVASNPAPDTPEPPKVSTKLKHSVTSIEVFQDYLNSCNAGAARGCKMTGYEYEHGDGVDKDVALAVQYYQKACDMGDSAGCRQAKYLLNKMNSQK